MNRIQFMNIGIDNVTIDEAVDYVKRCVMENKKTYVVTPNVDHMVKLQTNSKFLEAYNHAGLVAVDGTPIMLVSRWYKTPLKEKITGPRLTEKTIEMASDNRFSVFFLGAGPGVGERAAENLLKKYPNFNYVGYYSPPFGFEKDPAEKERIVEIINKANPDIVISGMGSPKTEIFLFEIYQKLNAKVSFSVGAAIDFFAGTVRRCPEWINKIGMEWLFRLLQDPKRMCKRYFVDDISFISCVIQYAKARRG